MLLLPETKLMVVVEGRRKRKEEEVGGEQGELKDES